MIKVIADNFMVCADCLSVIVNGDASSLDYSYSEEEAETRLLEIELGMANAGGNICLGDDDKDDEFSSRSCDCCNDGLAGPRYHCVVLA